MAERFAAGRLSTRDLLAVLAAGLRGGGRPITDEAVAALPLADGVEPVARAVADLLVATFGGAAETLRSRRTPDGGRRLPLGGGDGPLSRLAEPPRFLGRDAARARGGAGGPADPRPPDQRRAEASPASCGPLTPPEVEYDGSR